MAGFENETRREWIWQPRALPGNRGLCWPRAGGVGPSDCSLPSAAECCKGRMLGRRSVSFKKSVFCFLYMSVTTNVPERPAAGLGDRSGQPLAAAMIEAGRNELLAARGQRDNDEKPKACLEQRAAVRSPAAFGDGAGRGAARCSCLSPPTFGLLPADRSPHAQKWLSCRTEWDCCPGGVRERGCVEGRVRGARLAEMFFLRPWRSSDR